ncbi:unnamed protein product [Musa acuminata subsp. malaccensis]|uniref:Large ribosomal subunit protein bL34m n=1 Tax=Musa acuminata subsp. malaccensis TaxID=214687 RepID=A0A804KAR2_MUSAM|nr:unnamed protein product [Musa acuminata subsp. malaccensis]
MALTGLERHRSGRLLQSLAAHPPQPEACGGGERDTETLRVLTSSHGAFFPCGLPSLRFFIDEGNDDSTNESMLLLPKRTFQPSHVKRKRTHGYLQWKSTKGGRKVIARRLAKGRARIAVEDVAVTSQMDAGGTGSCHGDSISP